MPFRVSRVVMGSACVSFALGCGAGSSPVVIAPSAASQAIRGGYNDSTDTATVGIAWIQNNSMAMCTGSLIAPNLVLTAHHCVAPTLNEVGGGVDCRRTTFGRKGDPGGFLVTTRQALTNNESDYHPVVAVIVPTTSRICGDDIALLQLADNIPSTEAVPLVPRVDTRVSPNDGYSAIGYGATADNGAGSGQRRRLDRLRVACVGDACNAPDYMTGTEWLGDHGICEGDSGGPAIDTENRVVGVTSRGGAGCESPIYGDVFSWSALIKASAIDAAQAGGYDVPSWATGWNTDPAFNGPVGQACTQPTDCPPSNHCITDGDASYCTRLCDDVWPCGDGYICDATVTGSCLKAPPPPPDTGSGGDTGGGDPGARPFGCSAAGGEGLDVPGLLALVALGFRRRR